MGEHPMYMFGRSLTCDFQIEHPSASRQHAVLVHAQDGARKEPPRTSPHAKKKKRGALG